jgi:hypothetical protein
MKLACAVTRCVGCYKVGGGCITVQKRNAIKNEFHLPLIPCNNCVGQFICLLPTYLHLPLLFCHETSAQLCSGPLRGSTSIEEAKRLGESSFGVQVTQDESDLLEQTKDGKNTDDQSKFKLKRSICTAALISAVVADVEADSRIRIKALAPTYGMSAGTLFAIVHEDLGLVMKNARWVPKLLLRNRWTGELRLKQHLSR